jgi:hypothetical protein
MREVYEDDTMIQVPQDDSVKVNLVLTPTVAEAKLRAWAPSLSEILRSGVAVGGGAVHYTRCKNLASMIFRFQLTLSTLLRAGLQST